MTQPLDTTTGLTAECLRQAIHYDPVSGLFTWPSGKIAGYIERNGYIRINVCGHKYLAHRLAWLYVYGEWPKILLDHKDLDKSNNRIRNLREASYAENQLNAKTRRNSVSGIKGVRLHENGRYQARIWLDGRIRHLGLFETIEGAIQARKDAASKAHGAFVRH